MNKPIENRGLDLTHIQHHWSLQVTNYVISAVELLPAEGLATSVVTNHFIFKQHSEIYSAWNCSD